MTGIRFDELMYNVHCFLFFRQLPAETLSIARSNAHLFQQEQGGMVRHEWAIATFGLIEDSQTEVDKNHTLSFEYLQSGLTKALIACQY
jgi:hypothetical protein